MIFCERTRVGHHLSDKHWNCFKGGSGEISERWGGWSTYGLFRAYKYHLQLNSADQIGFHIIQGRTLSRGLLNPQLIIILMTKLPTSGTTEDCESVYLCCIHLAHAKYSRCIGTDKQAGAGITLSYYDLLNSILKP